MKKLTLVDGSVTVFQENTCALAVLESGVILIRHGRVYHHDVMLVMIMKVSDKLLHLFQRESIRIQRENLDPVSIDLALVEELTYLSQIHVVNVGPHCFQWYVSGRVVCNNSGDFIDILHAITTLMKSKAPIWHHDGLANDVAVLPSDINWARASQDVEIDDPSNHVVFEVLPSGIAVDVKIHTIAVQHENAVSFASALSVLEINRVVSVEVGSGRDQVRISRPECTGVVSSSASESVGIFSESIDIRIIRKRCAKSDIL